MAVLGETKTKEQLLDEIAYILVLLENGHADDAQEVASQLVGDSEYHANAFGDYVRMRGMDEFEAGDDLAEDFLINKEYGL